VYRRVLEDCTTIAEAEKLLRGMKADDEPTCLAISDKEGSAVFRDHAEGTGGAAAQLTASACAPITSARTS